METLGSKGQVNTPENKQIETMERGDAGNHGFSGSNVQMVFFFFWKERKYIFSQVQSRSCPKNPLTPLDRIGLEPGSNMFQSHPKRIGMYLEDPPMTCKWLITMVIVKSSPKDRDVGPLPNGMIFQIGVIPC